MTRHTSINHTERRRKREREASERESQTGSEKPSELIHKSLSINQRQSINQSIKTVGTMKPTTTTTWQWMNKERGEGRGRGRPHPMKFPSRFSPLFLLRCFFFFFFIFILLICLTCFCFNLRAACQRLQFKKENEGREKNKQGSNNRESSNVMYPIIVWTKPFSKYLFCVAYSSGHLEIHYYFYFLYNFYAYHPILAKLRT